MSGSATAKGLSSEEEDRLEDLLDPEEPEQGEESDNTPPRSDPPKTGEGESKPPAKDDKPKAKESEPKTGEDTLDAWERWKRGEDEKPPKTTEENPKGEANPDSDEEEGEEEPKGQDGDEKPEEEAKPEEKERKTWPKGARKAIRRVERRLSQERRLIDGILEAGKQVGVEPNEIVSAIQTVGMLRRGDAQAIEFARQFVPNAQTPTSGIDPNRLRAAIKKVEDDYDADDLLDLVRPLLENPPPRVPPASPAPKAEQPPVPQTFPRASSEATPPKPSGWSPEVAAGVGGLIQRIQARFGSNAQPIIQDIQAKIDVLGITPSTPTEEVLALVRKAALAAIEARQRKPAKVPTTPGGSVPAAKPPPPPLKKGEAWERWKRGEPTT